MTTRMTRRTAVVLVVDDEEYVRDVARRMLGRMGHSVLCAEDGAVGLEALEREHVDAILLDMAMPRMGGKAVLDALSKTHPELVSRVIVVTGHPPEGGEEYAASLGIHDYLRKPYNVRQLEWKVQQVLELAALQERSGVSPAETGEALHERLTPRQLQVLIRVAQGKTLKWIADDLRISVRTAREHRLNGLRRMGMNETTEWTRYAVGRGLLKSDEQPADPAG